MFFDGYGSNTPKNDSSQGKIRQNQGLYNQQENGRNIIDPASPGTNDNGGDTPPLYGTNQQRVPDNPPVVMADKMSESRTPQISLIAISGSGDKNSLLKMLEAILYSGRKRSLVTELPVIVDTRAERSIYVSNLKFDCGILMGLDLPEEGQTEERTLKGLSSFFSRISPNKPIIVNSDGHSNLKVLEKNKEAILITYGLSTKAAVTASSIDYDELTSFNYCLQRSIFTKKGNIIDPFEMPISMKLLGNHNIYNALAAITCALYYDMDMEQIKEALREYNGIWRQFQKVYENKFTIIDNFCREPADFKAAFESVQLVSYRDLHMVISIRNGASLDSHRENARLIAEWVKLLHAGRVILTASMQNEMNFKSISSRILKIYKQEFKNNDIDFRYYIFLQHAIESTLKGLKTGDMLLTLGGSEMNSVQGILRAKLGGAGALKQ